MRFSEAYSIIKKQFKDKKVFQCRDMEDKFVFTLGEKDYVIPQRGCPATFSVSVNKNTGEVSQFNPFVMKCLDEYLNSPKIEIPE